MSTRGRACQRRRDGAVRLAGRGGPVRCGAGRARFLNHAEIPFHALIEPAQDAVRSELARRPGRFVLVVHDRCMFNFNRHTSKRDPLRPSHDTDLGYGHGAPHGRGCRRRPPAGADGVPPPHRRGHAFHPTGRGDPPAGHVNELDEAMAAAAGWGLGHTPVHVIDREAASVGHYRRWHAAGYRFVVRADCQRVALHEDRECKLSEVAAGLAGSFTDVRNPQGRPRGR